MDFLYSILEEDSNLKRSISSSCDDLRKIDEKLTEEKGLYRNIEIL